MRLFGLIGYPLTHSYSEYYFSRKFKSENILNTNYKLFPIDSISRIFDLINDNPDLKGLSVTIPYKESVMNYLNEIDKVAQEIGAVNTIKISITNGNLILKGYNTDVYGFEESFVPFIQSNINNAIILGSGGASKAVQYCLRKLNIDFKVVSRNPEYEQIGYSELNKILIEEHKIIINCSPTGMYPNITEYPHIPYKYICSEHYLFDLIYNPEETMFLKKGKERGASTKNGLEMLYEQAEKSWEIWNN